MLKELECIRLSRETLRRWLKEADPLPPPKNVTAAQNAESEPQRRPDRLHRRFPPPLVRCKPYALDDATGGKPLYGNFVKRESLMAYFEVCYQVFQKYSLPENLCLDRHSVFITTRHEGVHVKQTVGNPTCFQIAMAKININLIFAHSPLKPEAA
ncbi:hypothetical protein [Thermosulfurimonas dismutans]|uniref:Transposase n=1 Tax=Thermosulfurimonas dismutans TaxID=999894 RepID=A0A179D789_9BACT|nr:hypothetical protein [Thermosulfurimonas dismutans]OAQ21833.1 hypothetical protein TDIS_0351 [Thermosulfurimonas dismutans]